MRQDVLRIDFPITLLTANHGKLHEQGLLFVVSSRPTALSFEYIFGITSVRLQAALELYRTKTVSKSSAVLVHSFYALIQLH